MRWCCAWWWCWCWGWWWMVKTWMVMTMWADWKGALMYSSTSTTPMSPKLSISTPPGVRTNIVDEVPGLDVGPLVSVNVAMGDTARLPCRHPTPEEDTVNLVLWYLNHTSKPYLSYDGRSDTDLRNSHSNRRTWLEEAGTSLVIQDVRLEDRAEYRCQVHYRLSPTWTQRLLLTVTGSVSKLTVLDGAGVPLESGRIGPLSEKSTLVLQCKANHGLSTVESLIWLLDGKEIDRTWKETSSGITINRLEMHHLQHRHHRAQVTCRLTTRGPQDAQVAANITDIMTVITMFRVPEVKLWVEDSDDNSVKPRIRTEGGRRGGGGSKGGGWSKEEGGGGGGGGGWAGAEWEVNEGSSVTFICSVSADPPAYNVTWLHHGRLVGVGGRRWRKDNSSLVITTVTRNDGGLYTCLASNREGDGHSNAVLLRIAHSPQCLDPTEKHVVVATNSSVNLTCEMDALPENLTFSWTMVDAPPEQGQENGVADVRGGIITGDAPPHHHPGLIDLTPDDPSDTWPWLAPSSPGFPSSGGGSLKAITDGGFDGSVLQHRVDSSNPTRSILTVAPSAPVQLLCYAKNRLGRTRIPCTYILSIVEPPEPLRSCNLTSVDMTRIEVRCDDLAPAKDVTDPNYAPGLSFVRSSEVRTTTNLQVWSGGTLIANVSADRPEFTVDDLPPGTTLQLALFAVSPHARSRPVYMYAQTLPRLVVHMTEPSSIDRDFNDFHGEDAFWEDMSGVLGGVVGCACVMLLILVGVFVVIWCRQRRRREAMEENSAFPHSLSTPAGTLSREESQTQLDSRPSVYCVSGTSESRGSDAPWLESSITPLVAPVTPMTPTQPRIETLILEDSTSSDVK